ncbi:MAG: hypothetical protein VYE73_13225 [Acidobacteriota bacterium]|nr:hypothetical protein [Acidobacteriota bacterium]
MSDREDVILERLLQLLENPELEDPGLDLSDEERELWREYSELAGLLPHALDPVQPSAGTRAVPMTLEEDPSIESPTGELVLYGDESQEML